MPYIPKHCDQQGRVRQTGVWLPRRVHDAADLPRDEFAQTFSDGKELDGAHAATPLLADTEDAGAPLPWIEKARLVAPFVIGVAAAVALALYGWR